MTAYQGKRTYVETKDGKLKVYDAKTGELLYELAINCGGVSPKAGGEFVP